MTDQNHYLEFDVDRAIVPKEDGGMPSGSITVYYDGNKVTVLDIHECPEDNQQCLHSDPEWIHVAFVQGDWDAPVIIEGPFSRFPREW